MVEAYEVDCEFPGIGRRKMLLNVRQLQNGPDAPGRILIAIEDVADGR